MKKHLFLFAFSLTLLSFGRSQAFAQSNDLLVETSEIEALAGLTSDGAAALWKTVPVTSVPEKVVRSFSGSFQNPGNTQWSSFEKFYLAEFMQGGCKSRALFAKNGYMQYAVSRGNEKDLPEDVREIVKSNYVDYTIETINQVQANRQTAWLVNLKGTKDYVIVRVMDRMLDEYNRYTFHAKPRHKGRISIPH